MLNRSVIAALLFMGVVFVSISTIGNFDEGVHHMAFSNMQVLP